MENAVVVQNEATKLDVPVVDSTHPSATVCRDAAVNVFERVMNWHPLHQTAEIAAVNLIAKMENDTFFETQLALTERQQEHIKEHIATVFKEAASAAIAKVRDFEKQSSEFIGNIVIQELMKIPEATMHAIGEVVNRGALLAMTAVEANSTNEDYDKIGMRKSKITGDITIPTRGIFISTNVVEEIKANINFRYKPDVDTKVT